MTELSYAERARAKKTAQANALGIDDALISNLVEKFYGAIRADALLGPIFKSHVADWTPHLARMKDFWASVTLESGRFRGNPMLKHIAVGGLDSLHFDRWLVLWNQTLDDVAPSEAAAQVFREAADRIASSLLTGIKVQRGGLDAISKPEEKQSC
ncbi:group III truncated hemoglobin [Parasphingorhabdus sp.]|uniref:group III truncated hemoglobin n=1 Tax=Parasphingorhabdus sp. TaxID=2709688 RepID=UPI001B4BE790|nr:group III truncated hemoglobin [Parasphingorhabdus sp.]MBQ0771134.1 group III truncated hemoglobin [Sphingomonadales bacterium]|tara:strand:- start:593 stop:1057 length:465 start_codon:yes stop_codon:yes gene_type:complete